MKKAVILLSGGLDSAVGLAVASRQTDPVMALTFDYGQRAASREIEASSRLAAHYQVAHRVIGLDFLAEITGTGLVNKDIVLQDSDDVNLVWVPNRNGLFVNIAAGFAESMGATLVVAGFNAEEGAVFPDNSSAYVQAANQALSYSTMNGVEVISFTQQMSKTDILALARELDIPLDWTWSCYEGGEERCGRCASCRLLARAMGEEGSR